MGAIHPPEVEAAAAVTAVVVASGMRRDRPAMSWEKEVEMAGGATKADSSCPTGSSSVAACRERRRDLRLERPSPPRRRPPP